MWRTSEFSLYYYNSSCWAITHISSRQLINTINLQNIRAQYSNKLYPFYPLINLKFLTQTSEYLWTRETEPVHRTCRPREDSRGMVPRNFSKMRMIVLITPGKPATSDCSVTELYWVSQYNSFSLKTILRFG